MERLTKITMQAFRGVRDAYEIALPEGQSLLMFGDNGTGKSSLADGIEWYFTGEIELLAKEGREHAIRHLGASKEQTTLVALETNGSLGGITTLKAPNKDAIEAAARETFLLRGRTIADFVDKSKGEKWTALQRLLGLGAIDELRADVQKARNDLKKSRDEAQSKLKPAAAALQGHKVEPERDKVVGALAKLASACGLEPQTNVDDYLSLDIATLVEKPKSTSRATLIASLIAEIEATNLDIEIEAFEKWNALLEDATTVDATEMDLLGSAAKWLKAHPDAKACPLCDKKVSAEAMSERLQKTLASLKEHASKFGGAEQEARDVSDVVDEIVQERQRWRTKARDAKVELVEVPKPPRVEAAIKERSKVDEDAVHDFIEACRAWDDAAKRALGAGAPPTEEEGSAQRTQAFELMQLLVVAKTWSDATKALADAEAAFQRADAIFEVFQSEQRKYVTEVLEQISTEVGRLFSKLHPAGRVGSVAVETWADKGIELAVDFHGSRQRPPHGVLSESYMNSVAIVMFLAMARTFNERLQFLVLDDVVNSFDVTHRGRLGELLLEEFQDWQLVVLTHDRYFYEQIRRKVKGWQTYQVVGWSYERGPSLREQRAANDIDAAIELLDQGNVGDAARRGRRGFETLLKEICEGLEVPLPYKRGNENEFREIGSLMNGLRRLLKEDSKGKQFLASIDGTLRSLEADAQSVLNAEAHSSESAGPSSSEVRSTLDRLKDFDALWSCPKCSSRVWKEQGVRCKCGATPFPPPRPSQREGG